MASLEYLTGSAFSDRLMSFVESTARPFYETQALKAVYGIESVTDLSALDLYQHHFALFRMLYQLQERYYSTGKYLHVHFMRSFLSSYPDPGKCREYDEHTGLFCGTDTNTDSLYCPFHTRTNDPNALENSSLKFFYYSDFNYDSIDEIKAEAFISGTWELLFNYNTYKNAIEILNLPSACTIDMVKTAYKKLAKIHHPDMNSMNVSDTFLKINDAYQFLLKTIPSLPGNMLKTAADTDSKDYQ